MNYNPDQQKAIKHKDGPMMVLAGPGSGKTSVITGRTLYMIKQQKISPASILVVTFTKASAREMRERFLKLANVSRTEVTFGTFHSVFFGILRHAYHIDANNILRDEEKSRIIKGLIDSHGLDITDEKEFIENITREISLVKNNRIEMEYYYSTTCSEEVFRDIYTKYENTCKSMRKLDFDDMLVYCYELFVKRPDILKLWQDKFKYILIDEFQDINQIQYEVIKMLATPRNNLFIVGDDDQSIYQFRGAKPEIMLQFPKEYEHTKTIHLTVNYRCTGEIVARASQLLKQNKNRFQKHLKANKEQGKPIYIKQFENIQEEVQHLLWCIQDQQEQGIPFEEMAVLFRTNMGARAVVGKFLEYNIPFQMRDSLPNIFEHWIAKNMITYMQMSQGTRSRGDFLQVMNRPNRYIARDAMGSAEMDFEDLYCFYEEKPWMVDRIAQWEHDLKVISRLSPFAAITYIRKSVGYDEYLEEYADYRRMNVEDLNDVMEEVQQSAKGFQTYEAWMEHIESYTESLKEAARQAQIEKKGVNIATLHSVKGLEYHVVFILDVNEGIIPYRKAVLDHDLEEERRMFYVGMTRAREFLGIFSIKERYEKKLELSRFVEEIKVPKTGKE